VLELEEAGKAEYLLPECLTMDTWTTSRTMENREISRLVGSDTAILSHVTLVILLLFYVTRVTELLCILVTHLL
jgi:DNA primase large subunit